MFYITEVYFSFSGEYGDLTRLLKGAGPSSSSRTLMVRCKLPEKVVGSETPSPNSTSSSRYSVTPSNSLVLPQCVRFIIDLKLRRSVKDENAVLKSNEEVEDVSDSLCGKFPLNRHVDLERVKQNSGVVRQGSAHSRDRLTGK